MKTVNVDNVGRVGIIEDLDDHMLPPEAWTSGSNVRFYDNSVEKIKGYAEVFATPLNAPYFLTSMKNQGVLYWVYPGLEAVGVVSAGTHADITRASGGDYNATYETPWTGGNLSGILVLNNFNDVPQYWATPGLANKLADLTAWPSDYRCKALVPYKQHLFALHMQQAGVVYPNRILWSDIADPGALPGSWDITDETKDAGQTELNDDSTGGLVNGCTLGDVLMLYKENAIWAAYPRSDGFIFDFDLQFKEVGLAAPHAIAEVPQRKEQLFFSGDDILKHNGTEMESVLSSRYKRALQASLNAAAADKCFMVLSAAFDEIWFAFPTSGSDTPNKILVINYKSGALGFRDITPVVYMTNGTVDLSASNRLWDNISDTWDTRPEAWGDTSASMAGSADILTADAANTKLYKMNYTNQNAGSNMTAYIERTGLSIIGYDRNGQPKTDLVRRKIVTRIWPKMEGGPVTIRALAQENKNGPITYSNTMSFNPSTDRYVDLTQPLSGVLLGIRIESTTDVAWKLDGYAFDMSVLGNF